MQGFALIYRRFYAIIHLKVGDDMAFKTNPYLEELEKKHPKLFFIISLIILVLVLLFGFWYLFEFKEDINEDKLVPILMIILGTLGLICTLLLKIFKK